MVSCLNNAVKDTKLLVLSESKRINKLVEMCVSTWGLQFDITFVLHDDFLVSNEQYKNQFSYIILFADSDFDSRFEPFERLFSDAFSAAQVMCVTSSKITEARIAQAPENVCFFYTPGDFNKPNMPYHCNDHTRVVLALLHLSDIDNFALLIPKYSLSENTNLNALIDLDEYDELNFYDLKLLQGAPKNFQDFQAPVMKNGTRPSYSGCGLSAASLTLHFVSDEVLDKNRRLLLENHPYLRDNEYV